jgi:hypothetical protein
MAHRDDWTAGDITGIVANPFYAINIDQGLALPHEPMISEDDWIKANVKLIRELGPGPYLRNLLSILKGCSPTMSPPFRSPIRNWSRSSTTSRSTRSTPTATSSPGPG